MTELEQLVSDLIDWAYAQGHELGQADAAREKAIFAALQRSSHVAIAIFFSALSPFEQLWLLEHVDELLVVESIGGYAAMDQAVKDLLSIATWRGAS